jgi:hypothetical protein
MTHRPSTHPSTPYDFRIPRRRSTLAGLRARAAGHSDARSGRLRDEQAHLPYTWQLHAAALLGQSGVSARLHHDAMPIDRQIAAAATRIVTVTQQRALLDETERQVPPRRPGGTPEAIDASRQRAERQVRGAAAAETLGGLQQQLVSLLTDRRHLVEGARDAAAAWGSRFDELTAVHARALSRRRRGRHPGQVHDARLPQLRAELPWIEGDLPLLSSAIDAETAEVVRWFFRTFAPRGAAGDPDPLGPG